MKIETNLGQLQTEDVLFDLGIVYRVSENLDRLVNKEVIENLKINSKLSEFERNKTKYQAMGYSSLEELEQAHKINEESYVEFLVKRDSKKVVGSLCIEGSCDTIGFTYGIDYQLELSDEESIKKMIQLSILETYFN